ncbi:energy transducer TonB [Winogradskyella vidalii]|uniref:energy transducer TonB n=1 Tax=Winogradskyella vidalii TaxID=2615024 RepID=UPI001FE2CB4E|nr:energy transducer TonB [Winogradskyella vidalii]
MATPDMVIHLPEVFIGTKSPTVYEMQTAEMAGIVLEQPQTPIWQIIALVGIGITTLIFLIKITKLYWLKYKNPKRWKGNVLIVNLIQSSAAFSFFNTIFLGERISEAQKPTIYKHELVHIKEYHTLDLLFFELLRIVFWFNPLVYIYQNRIKELHEYIADAQAVKQSGKSEYYTSLLNQVLDVNQPSFTNTFFSKSLIKKRIAMLQKSKSKQLNLVKYGLLIPLVLGMLIYTSTEVRAQEKRTEQEQFADQELTDAELVKKYHTELIEMHKKGGAFEDFMNFASFGEKNIGKYVLSREEYLKSQALRIFITNDTSRRKSEEGSLIQEDIDFSELMKEEKYQNYEDYRAYKKTKEAKEHWELNTQYGILKLIVDDFSNLTEEEQKRYNAVLKQLETDKFFKKLVVVSGETSTIIIDSPHAENQESHILKDEEEHVEVPFSVVEETPTTLDCQDLENNSERKKCMNNFVNKHIGKNFNTSVADNLSPGRKRIFVQFKIDTDGMVKDIKARGPSPDLETEAKRVIATLPQFVPGKQKGKSVVVPFSVPIVFQVAQKAGIDTAVNEKENLKTALNNSARKRDKKELVKYLKEEIKQLEKDIERSEAIPFSEVEVSPLFPDCKSVSDGLSQKKCFTTEISSSINKNFDFSLVNSLGLSAGKKRIFIQMILDKYGAVKNVIARGPHPDLEEEAVRVVKLLPQFTPGQHQGKAVSVAYSLPLVIEISATNKE